jgi:hypothetical protein
VIQERTEGERLAYAQGHKAGWEWALKCVRKGMSPQQVEDACMVISETTFGLLRGEDDA